MKKEITIDGIIYVPKETKEEHTWKNFPFPEDMICDSYDNDSEKDHSYRPYRNISNKDWKYIVPAPNHFHLWEGKGVPPIPDGVEWHAYDYIGGVGCDGDIKLKESQWKDYDPFKYFVIVEG